MKSKYFYPIFKLKIKPWIKYWLLKEKKIILPEGYTQLDYIKSSGTQYIDTGLTGEGKWKLKVQGSFSFLTQIIIGRSSSAGYWFGIMPKQENFYGNYGVGTQNIVSYFGPDLVDVELNTTNNSISGKVNDETIPTRNITNPDYINSSYLLFNARSAVGLGNFYYTGKFYYAKFYQNNNLIAHFIPCKNENNVVGLYDIVRNTFYTNQGSGDFIAGEEI